MGSEPPSLIENLRRLYNAVDLFFDRRSLMETIRESRSGGRKEKPVTANGAFSLCMPIAREIDREASLKLIVAPDGSIQRDGTSTRWEFLFDLPNRRAQLVCDWRLSWDEEADHFGEARIEVLANPFPPPDSVPRQMVKQGKLLHRHLIGMWRREHQRKGALQHGFRDSDDIMREFGREGLDVTETEVILKAEWKAKEGPSWCADGRDVSFCSPFA